MIITEITDEDIKFNDGTIITYEYDQDCSKNVYADFASLKDQNLIGKKINKIKIEGVKGYGIRINGFFVPCYNQQDGYYFSDLFLVIKHPDGSKTIQDISEFVEDDID